MSSSSLLLSAVAVVAAPNTNPVKLEKVDRTDDEDICHAFQSQHQCKKIEIRLNC